MTQYEVTQTPTPTKWAFIALFWLWAKRLLGEVREVMTATGNEWLERAAAWLPAPKQDHFVSTR